MAQEIEVNVGEIGLPTSSTPQEDHEMGTQERKNVQVLRIRKNYKINCLRF